MLLTSSLNVNISATIAHRYCLTLTVVVEKIRDYCLNLGCGGHFIQKVQRILVLFQLLLQQKASSEINTYKTTADMLARTKII